MSKKLEMNQCFQVIICGVLFLNPYLFPIELMANIETKEMKFEVDDMIIKRSLVHQGNVFRLKKAMEKASAGKKIVFGTIGGSITQGALASSQENCYANIVAKWFEDKFGKDRVEFINAGLGATGTGIAAHRACKDLLKYHPDVVITEFAVNDPNEKSYAETYEGLLRQILKQDNKPAVLMLFMVYKNGISAQPWQEKLGDYYDLPMISYRDALWPEIEARRVAWGDIAADVVHPNDKGHKYCAEFIIYYLEAVYNQAMPEKAADRPLLQPLISDKFEYTKLLTADNCKVNVNKGWEKSEVSPLGIGWQSSVPGSLLELEVEGCEIRVVCYQVKGDMGTIIAQVDSLDPVEIDSWFDQDWGGYDSETIVGKDMSNGKHTLKIRLLEKKNKASNGHLFKIRAIMVAGTTK